VTRYRIEQIKQTNAGKAHGHIDSAVRHCAELIRALEESRQALAELANEASGFLSVADVETHGHTNIAVLQLKIGAARECLYGDLSESGGAA
jgi:hypothetical protein